MTIRGSTLQWMDELHGLTFDLCPREPLNPDMDWTMADKKNPLKSTYLPGSTFFKTHMSLYKIPVHSLISFVLQARRRRLSEIYTIQTFKMSAAETLCHLLCGRKDLIYIYLLLNVIVWSSWGGTNRCANGIGKAYCSEENHACILGVFWMFIFIFNSWVEIWLEWWFFLHNILYLHFWEVMFLGKEYG